MGNSLHGSIQSIAHHPWLVVLVILLTSFPAFVVVLLRLSALKEVYNTPKVPMSLCDVHGMYPSDASLITTASAIGRADLKIELCPFCYDDRMRTAEAKLKKDTK